MNAISNRRKALKMRRIRDPQTTLRFQSTRIKSREQWEKMGEILDENPEIAQVVHQDLCRHADGLPKKNAGAKGMTADQVLRFAIVKFCEELSYRKLADRVDDSIVLREFCRIPFGQIPRFTTLQDNIKKLHPETLERIQNLLIDYACRQGIEQGERIRIDSTAVQSNIHHPTDARQLCDGVRVLTRILRRAETDIERLQGRFHDHTRVAKRLLYKINNARGGNNRKPLYKRLIKTARKTAGYAREAIEELAAARCRDFEELLAAAELRGALEHFAPLVERVIDQSVRRVLNGENVPAQDKVVSIFEPHSDIIVKGQREIVYGHKIFLTGGASNLILDCAIERGNPADSDAFAPALERHMERFGKAPHDVATDGGFASKDNGKWAKAKGVANVAFSALKGNTLAELVQSKRLYTMLRKWRAGIEGVISATKRAYGLTRCTWRSFDSFQAYVRLAVLAFNLKTLARYMLT